MMETLQGYQTAISIVGRTLRKSRRFRDFIDITSGSKQELQIVSQKIFHTGQALTTMKSVQARIMFSSETIRVQKIHMNGKT